MNRRQFATRTASTLLAFGNSSLLQAATSFEPVPLEGQIQSLTLRNYLGICDFPEELLSYPLSFGEKSVHAADLRLFLRGSDAPVPFQLTDVHEHEGNLRSATLHFRTDLKINEEKSFGLTARSEVPAAQIAPIEVVPDGDHLVIVSNKLQILVPALGKQTLNIRATQAPAPLLALSRQRGKWIGTGKLEAPDDLRVEEMEAAVLEQGPLFVKYVVRYTFNEDRSYTVILRVQHNESHLEIDELANGFGPLDHLAFRFSYKDGVDPNGRLFMANGGYSTGGSQQGASGTYDEGINQRGLLPIKLGIFAPNFINLPRAIAFWNDAGENAILFSLCRLTDWKTSQRALWSASALPDNLEFYSQRGDKFVRAAVVSAERHWAVALIARDDVIVCGVDMNQTALVPRPPDRKWKAVSSMEGMFPYGAGPEVRLLLKLNDFSLNRYKDCIFDFPEDMRTARFELPHTDISSQDMTGQEYIHTYKHNFAFLAQVGWDYSGNMGANHWGWSTHPESINYARNFMSWRPEERLQARSWLVFAAYLMELDTAMPQFSMLGGHPNFAAEYKQVLGIMAGLFPSHPHAARWRDTYLNFWDQYLDKYVRKGDAASGAKAGRFTESIACYNYASMEAICMAATGFKLFDGSHILERPEFHSWVRWEMQSRLPFRVSGARIVPPQGAHAGVAVLSPGGRWYNATYALAHLLRETAPVLAGQWLWMMTDGAEGTKPESVESALFQDYGPVFRHDFAGPDEAFVHLQQLNGSGYRWSSASNGAIYYAAKGKVWSWNQIETNGDNLDVSQLPALQVAKTSLGPSSTTSVLYNFDFAQYYRADADNSASSYHSRALMMIRADYLAIYDTLDETHAASFRWINETNGLSCHLYKDAEFKQLFRTITNDERFPLTFTEDTASDFAIPNGPFSIRATATFTPPVAGRYRFRTNWNTPQKDVPVSDYVHLMLDDKKVFEGKGPQNGEVQLETRSYTILFEYAHLGASAPFVMTSWMRPDKPNFGQIENAVFRSLNPMPFIHEAKGGPGDQLHLVAPNKLELTQFEPGCLRVGVGEYVLFGNTSNSGSDGPSFSGKAAYVTTDALALFQGDHLHYNGLGVTRLDGDFGVSVRRAGPDLLEGRIAGRTGGKLCVDLPPNFERKRFKVTFDGKDVPFDLQGSSLIFNVTISQSASYKAYRIFAI